MDEFAFHHALQQLKVEIDGMNQHYRSVLAAHKQQPYSASSYQTAASVFPDPHSSLPGGPTFWQLFQSLKGEVRGIDARVELVEDRVDKIEQQLHDPVRFTPPESVASDFATAHIVYPATSRMSDTATHAMEVKVAGETPVAAAEDIGFFHPELRHDKQRIDQLDEHLYTSDAALFVAKLRHAAQHKRLVNVGQFLRGSALRWFHLCLSSTGRHEFYTNDGTFQLEHFCHDFLLVYGKSSAFQSMAETQYTPADARAGRSLVAEYAIPILENARHLNFVSEDERTKLSRAMVRQGIRCDTSFSDSNAPERQHESISEYLSFLRRVEARILLNHKEPRLQPPKQESSPPTSNPWSAQSALPNAPGPFVSYIGQQEARQIDPALPAVSACVPPLSSIKSPSSHALQDYQMQLMLLEQQNKKRLLMARFERDQSEQQAPKDEKQDVNRSQLQKMLLEQQNKAPLFTTSQECDAGEQQAPSCDHAGTKADENLESSSARSQQDVTSEDEDTDNSKLHDLEAELDDMTDENVRLQDQLEASKEKVAELQKRLDTQAASRQTLIKDEAEFHAKALRINRQADNREMALQMRERAMARADAERDSASNARDEKVLLSGQARFPSGEYTETMRIRSPPPQVDSTSAARSAAKFEDQREHTAVMPPVDPHQSIGLRRSKHGKMEEPYFKPTGSLEQTCHPAEREYVRKLRFEEDKRRHRVYDAWRSDNEITDAVLSFTAMTKPQKAAEEYRHAMSNSPLLRSPHEHTPAESVEARGVPHVARTGYKPSWREREAMKREDEVVDASSPVNGAASPAEERHKFVPFHPKFDTFTSCSYRARSPLPPLPPPPSSIRRGHHGPQRARSMMEMASERKQRLQDHDSSDRFEGGMRRDERPTYAFGKRFSQRGLSAMVESDDETA